MTLAAGEGTQSDPLVTLSYLTQTAAPSILDQVDQQTAQYQRELEQRLESAIQSYTAQMDAALGSSGGAQSAATYTVVTLSSGQQLDMEVGCEVMLRIGTAVCVSPSSPGLIDTTTGSALNDGGALVTNHLYMGHHRRPLRPGHRRHREGAGAGELYPGVIPPGERCRQKGDAPW